MSVALKLLFRQGQAQEARVGRHVQVAVSAKRQVSRLRTGAERAKTGAVGRKDNHAARARRPHAARAVELEAVGAAGERGRSKAEMLLPWVSLRGRRSGLLTAAATGNPDVLNLTLAAILEADAATRSGDAVRARLREKARFSTLARAMEGAASRGHEECCVMLWDLCDEKARERGLAAASLNGHTQLVEVLKGRTKIMRVEAEAEEHQPYAEAEVYEHQQQQYDVEV